MVSPTPDNPHGRISTWIAFGLLIGMAVLLGLRAVRSWDLWWHMLTAQQAIATGSTLPNDIFSITVSGHPWIYKDLGSELVLYGVFSLGGGAGLAILRLVATLGVCLLILATVRRRTNEHWIALLVATAALSLVAFRLIVRPEIFSMLMLPFVVLLIEKRRQSGSVRVLFFIALSLWLWANLHRGVLSGLVLVWGYAGYELLGAVFRKLGWGQRSLLASPVTTAQNPTRVAGQMGLAAVIGTGLVCVNPSGFVLFKQALAVSGSETMGRLVSEWQRLTLTELWDAFPVACLWMLLLVLFVTVAFFKTLRSSGDESPGTTVGLWDLGVCCVFLYAGLKTPRMLPIMVIATAPTLASAIASSFGNMALRWSKATIPVPLLAVGAMLLVGWRTHVFEMPDPGLADNWYPEAGVNLIDELDIEGEGFTSYTYAGYMLWHLWPEKHVICDGRYDTVYSEEIIGTCIVADHFPDVFARWVELYDLQWVLTHNRPDPRNFNFLDSDPAWALIHWDPTSLLYLRVDGPNRNIAFEHGYRYLRPHAPDMSVMYALSQAGSEQEVAAIEIEVTRLLDLNYADYRALIIGVLFYGSTQRDSERLELLVEALEGLRETDPASIDQVLDWLSEQSGNDDSE